MESLKTIVQKLELGIDLVPDDLELIGKAVRDLRCSLLWGFEEAGIDPKANMSFLRALTELNQAEYSLTLAAYTHRSALAERR